MNRIKIFLVKIDIPKYALLFMIFFFVISIYMSVPIFMFSFLNFVVVCLVTFMKHIHLFDNEHMGILVGFMDTFMKLTFHT